MLTRFVLYGVFGCFGEVVWTSTSASLLSLAGRASFDPRLRGQTYLWMFPIYGLGGLVFERFHTLIGAFAWPLRGAMYIALIFCGEYVFGTMIRRLAGAVPWDYTGARFSVHGLIRLDYAPVWFCVGLITEATELLVGAAAPAIELALSRAG